MPKLTTLYLSILAALPLVFANPQHEPTEIVPGRVALPGYWWFAQEHGIALPDDVLEVPMPTAITNPTLTAYSIAALDEDMLTFAVDHPLPPCDATPKQRQALAADWFNTVAMGMPRDAAGFVVLPTKWGIPCV